MASSGEHRYTLRLTEAERGRYRMMAAMALQDEVDLWTQAGIVPGARVADVGCGPGAILVELGRIVGPGGVAIGVEPGRPAREAAREELDAAGLQHVEVREGNGEETGLDPSSWDTVMVRHVLTHTGAAADRIVAHLATLLAPGGHLYLVDVDLDAIRCSPPDPRMQEQFDRYAAFHRALGNDARIGTRLGSMMRAVGLEIVENRGLWRRVPAALLATGGPLVSAQDEMIAAGVLSVDEVEPWQEARQRFGAQPDAELWMANFIAVGKRPLTG